MSNGYWSRILTQRINRRHALAFGATATGAAFLAACGGGGKNDSATASLTATAAKPRLEVPDPKIAIHGELIAPKDTDPSIDSALEPHYVVFSPSQQARGRLFLFMAGTGNFPEEHRLISDQAARNGFHVVNLMYSNSISPESSCRMDPETICAEQTRLEILDGTERSAKVNVNRANSIENRLQKVLAHLHGKYADEGWSAYGDSTTLRWASIVAAGHSQGAGQAVLAARDHLLARVGMFSGPSDRVGPSGLSFPAPWLLGHHTTPSDRYYAFGHRRDEGISWERHWKALGLGLTDFGPPGNVDSDAPPYGGSHILLTNAQPGKPVKPAALNHSSTVRDDTTPKTPDGQPLFAPVWQYMCFA